MFPTLSASSPYLKEIIDFIKIEEVKDYFANEHGDEDADDSGEMSYTMLTFNPFSPATKEGLIGMLPERSVVDRLIARYFNSHSPSLREFAAIFCFGRGGSVTLTCE